MNHPFEEKIVLGCAILKPEHLYTAAAQGVTKNTFYNNKHRIVWSVLESMMLASQRVDELSVIAKIKLSGLSAEVSSLDVLELVKFIGMVPPNIDVTISLLKDAELKRQMMETANFMGRNANTATPVAQLLSKANTMFTQMNLQLGGGKSFIDIRQALVNADNHLEEVYNNGGRNGIMLGIDAFDNATLGLKNGELYIIAARPGMGKTAFALQLARNVAVDAGVGVAFISLEMPYLQLVNRLQANECGIPLSNFLSAQLTDAQLVEKNHKVARLAASPLLIDDTAGLNILQLTAKARALKHLHNIGLLVVDYLQLIQPAENNSRTNREQDISHISRGLKLLAKELGIPVVALSQLSRAVEGRPSKMPQLADLRESGAIEQDADMVCFLFRPEYYGITHNGRQPYAAGHTSLLIAKNRNGPLCTVNLRFNAEIQRFY